MASILLIDDDQSLCTLLTQYLQGAGHEGRYAIDSLEGIRLLYEYRPDLVILDVAMPRNDGWKTLSRIRENSDVPVIMLTARDDETDVLRGFSLGADDYVTKPFSFAQLAARIGAVISRAKSEPGENDKLLEVAALKIDLAVKRVTRDDIVIRLTPTEFRLLMALALGKGEVVPSQDLVREVWGPQYAEDVGNVRRYIWHLRKKIEPDPDNPRYIHTERGYGYSLYFLADPDLRMPDSGQEKVKPRERMS